LSHEEQAATSLALLVFVALYAGHDTRGDIEGIGVGAAMGIGVGAAMGIGVGAGDEGIGVGTASTKRSISNNHIIISRPVMVAEFSQSDMLNIFDIIRSK
jgi:hypothetical protein